MKEDLSYQHRNWSDNMFWPFRFLSSRLFGRAKRRIYVKLIALSDWRRLIAREVDVDNALPAEPDNAARRKMAGRLVQLEFELTVLGNFFLPINFAALAGLGSSAVQGHPTMCVVVAVAFLCVITLLTLKIQKSFDCMVDTAIALRDSMGPASAQRREAEALESAGRFLRIISTGKDPRGSRWAWIPWWPVLTGAWIGTCGLLRAVDAGVGSGYLTLLGVIFLFAMTAGAALVAAVMRVRPTVEISKRAASERRVGNQRANEPSEGVLRRHPDRRSWERRGGPRRRLYAVELVLPQPSEAW